MLIAESRRVLNSKKRETSIRDVEIWLLMAIPGSDGPVLYPALKVTPGLHRAVNQAVVARSVRLSPRAQRDGCFQEPTSETFLFASGADRGKVKGKQVASKESAISKLS